MHFSHTAWFVLFAVAGMFVLAAVVVPEARNHPLALGDPAWWFWVTIFAVLMVGIIPFAMVFGVGLP